MDKNQLPPLRQASIFDVRAMSEAERASLGYLVLVMRRWPQGFSWEALDLQLWLPDAGPSPELLKAYQAKQIDWEEFAQRYRVEQIGNWRRAGYYKVGKGDEGRRESQMSPLQHLDELRRQYGLVTVLCHERKGHCHRYVLEKLAHDKDGNEQSTSQILEPPTMQEQEKPQGEVNGQAALIIRAGEKAFNVFTIDVEQGRFKRLASLTTRINSHGFEEKKE